MASRNDVTGDAIVSRASNSKYADGWELAFGKKNKSVEDTKVDSSSECPAFKLDPLNAISTTELLKNVDANKDPFLPPVYANFSISLSEGKRIREWLRDEVYPDVIAKQKLDPNYEMWKYYMGKNGEEYPYAGAIGGGVTYSFTPTSIGVIVKVKAYDKEYDVTDYENF